MFAFDRVLLEWRARRAVFPEPPQLAPPAPDERERWALETLIVAESEVGNGEEGGNNLGPHVARYCAPHGDGHLWCAGLQGWCISTAASRLQMPMLVKRSLSALQLGENIAAVGHKVRDWRALLPGDFLVLKRSGGHHILIVRSVGPDLVYSVEGNRRPKVGLFVRYPDQERIAFGASLRRG